MVCRAFPITTFGRWSRVFCSGTLWTTDGMPLRTLWNDVRETSCSDVLAMADKAFAINYVTATGFDGNCFVLCMRLFKDWGCHSTRYHGNVFQHLFQWQYWWAVMSVISLQLERRVVRGMKYRFATSHWWKDMGSRREEQFMFYRDDGSGKALINCD